MIKCDDSFGGEKLMMLDRRKKKIKFFEDLASVLLPRFSASAGFATSVFPFCPRWNFIYTSTILWSGRALDSVLLPAFDLCLLLTHTYNALTPMLGISFLLGWKFLRSTGHSTTPTARWKKLEPGFCSCSRVFGLPFGFSQIPFLFVIPIWQS